jgi:hypothetical protein
MDACNACFAFPEFSRVFKSKTDGNTLTPSRNGNGTFPKVTAAAG